MSRFKLANGREIHIVAINQWETYQGLLEGVPTIEMNARRIAYAKGEARRLWGCEPLLIHPTEVAIVLGRQYPFGTPASIPNVTCIALFRCYDTARDESMDGSELPLVWFQPEFAFPIEGSVRESIHFFDWENFAMDFGL